MVINKGTRRKGEPVYAPLAEMLRRQIQSGSFAEGDFVGREADLAELAGIGRRSVRRAVDILVGEGLVERRPGRGNGLFVRKKAALNRAVKLIMPTESIRLWADLAAGARQAGRERGLDILVQDTQGDEDGGLGVLEHLPESMVSAAIIRPPDDPMAVEILMKLKLSGFPFVLLDFSKGLAVPLVTSDHYAGGHLAGERLAELGHQRIGFLGDTAIETIRLRLDGLRDALAERDLVVRPDWISKADEGVAVARMMSLPERPSAIFCGNDGIAAVCMKALKALGLSVPGDISVVGFDDEDFCELLEPTLSTVRQPAFEMGVQAVELLVKQMQGLLSEDEMNCTLPVTWVERHSTSRINEKE